MLLQVMAKIFEGVRTYPVDVAGAPDLKEIVNGGEVDECNRGPLSSYGGRSSSH